MFFTEKPSTSIDTNVPNNKQSQNTNDQSKVKVRLKPVSSSSSLQMKKDNKPVTSVKTTKSVVQKPINK